MSKRTKADKWIYYFTRYMKPPENETPGMVYSRGTFHWDYEEMNKEDKYKLWDAVYKLKTKSNANIEVINKILTIMYNVKCYLDMDRCTESHRNCINKVKTELLDPTIIDLRSIVVSIPYTVLEELLTPYKVYFWEQFKILNIDKLNDAHYRDILLSSNFFQDVMQLEEISPGIIDHDFELKFQHYSQNVKKCFIQCDLSLAIPILENVQATTSFIFCPDMLIILLGKHSNLGVIKRINERIIEIETQISFLQGPGNNFTFPLIIENNLTLVKKRVAEREALLKKQVDI